VFDARDGDVALLGLERVPADRSDLAVGADQVLDVLHGLGEAQVVKVKHVLHQIKLRKNIEVHLFISKSSLGCIPNLPTTVRIISKLNLVKKVSLHFSYFTILSYISKRSHCVIPVFEHLRLDLIKDFSCDKTTIFLKVKQQTCLIFSFSTPSSSSFLCITCRSNGSLSW
jgi:hypothetical protein